MFIPYLIICILESSSVVSERKSSTKEFISMCFNVFYFPSSLILTMILYISYREGGIGLRQNLTANGDASASSQLIVLGGDPDEDDCEIPLGLRNYLDNPNLIARQDQSGPELDRL